ncbi:MAG: hypothetical protein ACYC64_03945 [Armatimonadota bacterium]
MHPPAEHISSRYSGFFNESGEIDFSNKAVYEFLCDQLEELHDLVTGLSGIEMWVMEGAQTIVSRLEHQTLPINDIMKRIVDVVYEKTTALGIMLAVDLHTAGANRPALEGLLTAAQRHPKIIVSADNVIGDFNLNLPFNEHLRRAKVTNPIQVHFDVNGEYWGRNFVPTCALTQYTAHIEEARSLGAEYIDGRIATCHDLWSSSAEVLPSRRILYPALSSDESNDQSNDQNVRLDESVSKTTSGFGSEFLWRSTKNVQVCCFDTLSGFNAEFFCRRVKDSSTEPLSIVREFLCREFGPEAADLASVFIDVESVAARLYFANTNYFFVQSVPPALRHAGFFGHDVHFVAASGSPIPPVEGLGIPPVDLGGMSRAQFMGWPTPLGLRASGPDAMISEKRSMLVDATCLLAGARAATENISPEHRTFIIHQFEDFIYFARAADALLEAMVYYFHYVHERDHEFASDLSNMHARLQDIEVISSEWEERYPDDRWVISARLRSWHKRISDDIRKLDKELTS